MRPMDSAYDRSCAASESRAAEVLDLDQVQIGDSVDYGPMADLDDVGRDWLRDQLAALDVALYDLGGELRVGWMYAKDGSRLDYEQDAVFAGEQPATSAECERLQAEPDGEDVQIQD